MKALFYFILTLLFAVGLAVFLQNQSIADIDPGYVIIGYGRWSLETSLLFTVLTVTILFIALYVTLSLSFGILRLPFVLLRSGANMRSAQTQKAVANAYIASAEHMGPKAERTLIRHAEQADSPLMNYFTAARSAQARGAIEERDIYIAQAREKHPESELAIGLTEAELLLINRQTDEALRLLRVLREKRAGHEGLMDLYQQALRQKGEWAELLALVPQLLSHNIVTGTALRDLEVEAYCNRLKQIEEAGDREALTRLWSEAPPRVQALQPVRVAYYRALIGAGNSLAAEEGMRQEIRKEWNEQLALIYGFLGCETPATLLARAETWYQKHSHNVCLLRTLGRLSVRAGEFEKAEKYLTSSVTIYATADAYMLLGDVHMAKGDTQRAQDCYHRAMTVFRPDDIAKGLEVHDPVV